MIRSRKYRDAVRGEPCCVAGKDCIGPVQACHTGPHGMGQKASDTTVIPLCLGHHGLMDHQIGRRAFEARFGIDIDAITSELNERFADLIPATA